MHTAALVRRSLTSRPSERAVPMSQLQASGRGGGRRTLPQTCGNSRTCQLWTLRSVRKLRLYFRPCLQCLKQHK